MIRNKGFIITNLGLGLLLQLPFADNGVLSSRRTFLVIGEEDNYVLMLNVSSTRGKEHKLLFDSNEEIINYNPPFEVKSFVKFDALYKVEKCTTLSRFTLCRGQSLDSNEFSRLYALYLNYVQGKRVVSSITTSEELSSYLS